MPASLTQDRRVTVLIQGITNPVSQMGPVSCGPSLHHVHEGFGYRALAPDRIQGDAVIPLASTRPSPKSLAGTKVASAPPSGDGSLPPLRSRVSGNDPSPDSSSLRNQPNTLDNSNPIQG